MGDRELRQALETAQSELTRTRAALARLEATQQEALDEAARAAEDAILRERVRIDEALERARLVELENLRLRKQLERATTAKLVQAPPPPAPLLPEIAEPRVSAGNGAVGSVVVGVVLIVVALIALADDLACQAAMIGAIGFTVLVGGLLSRD